MEFDILHLFCTICLNICVKSNIQESADIFLHLHFSHLARTFVQSDLSRQTQSSYCEAETSVNKILPHTPKIPTEGEATD